MIVPSQRLQRLPPYVFADLDQMVGRARAEGADVISFGIGDPDLPTPDFIIQALTRAAGEAKNHRYSPYEGIPEFREACARWMVERFGVTLDPGKEVLTLIGSKEGIGHLPVALLNPDDLVFIPDPGYPVYHSATILAGGVPYAVPLHPERGFLPDLAAIPSEVARKAKLFYLNYPNNPTGAVADLAFYERLVAFARKYEVILCSDLAYSEVAFGEYRPPSLLEIPGAREWAIEFHSLSKTFNMTGWRIGWAAGNAGFLKTLYQVKTNLDSGVFPAIQWAGVEALGRAREAIPRNQAIYQARRDLAVEGLRKMGIRVEPPLATFYIWAPVPAGLNSMAFVKRVFEKTHVVFTPGIGFGPQGEGYFRLALTVSTERMEEAFRRLDHFAIVGDSDSSHRR